MQHDDDSPTLSSSAQLCLCVIFINIVLALGATLCSAWLWRGRATVLRELAELEALENEGCLAEAADPTDKSDPPEDSFGGGYMGDLGVRLTTATLKTPLDVLFADGELKQRRFGDPAVLRPGRIHVVNLWATWCTPCKAELPGLRALFERRKGSWGDAVEFVPIKVLDRGNPGDTYEAYRDLLPASRVRLTDRELDDPFIRSLREDPARALFQGKLPVTFVLDCNRRVRWAQFKELGEVEMADLEDTLQRLVAERARPRSPCRQKWCGNGRCEGNEALAGPKFCELDCPQPRPSPPVLRGAAECPEGCAQCDELGVCKDPSASKKPTTRPIQQKVKFLPHCGDQHCDGGESSETCCRDCECQEPLACNPTAKGIFECVAGLQRE